MCEHERVWVKANAGYRRPNGCPVIQQGKIYQAEIVWIGFDKGYRISSCLFGHPWVEELSALEQLALEAI